MWRERRKRRSRVRDFIVLRRAFGGVAAARTLVHRLGGRVLNLRLGIPHEARDDRHHRGEDAVHLLGELLGHLLDNLEEVIGCTASMTEAVCEVQQSHA